MNLVESDPSKNFNLPHVGWNEINIVKNHKLFDGIQNKQFLFVHSYKTIFKNDDNLFAETIYLKIFLNYNKQQCGWISISSEKSSKNGLKILENFCSWKI